MKILLLDIETYPNVSLTWGKYDQDVIYFLEEWYILCFGYKWLGDNKVHVLALPDVENSERALLAQLWLLLDEADVVVAQNGDAFDVPRINTRFLSHGLKPPSPYKTVDTLKVARKFAFNSNKLDDLGVSLDEGRKVQHRGFSMWLKCAEGDAKAWAEMKKYNKGDIRLLEKVYRRFLPWISNHPAYGVYVGGQVCPYCGSGSLQSRGLQRNKTTSYQRLHCSDCGGWSRTVQSIKTAIKPLVPIQTN